MDKLPELLQLDIHYSTQISNIKYYRTIRKPVVFFIWKYRFSSARMQKNDLLLIVLCDQLHSTLCIILKILKIT